MSGFANSVTGKLFKTSEQFKHMLEDALSVSTMVFGTKCQHFILMQDGGALFHHLLKVPTH